LQHEKYVTEFMKYTTKALWETHFSIDGEFLPIIMGFGKLSRISGRERRAMR